MPKAFEACVASGGRVRRITGPSKQFALKGGQYRNVCFKNGKMTMGHVHSKKSS